MRRCVFAATVCSFAVALVAAQQPADRQTFHSGRDVLTIEASVTGANDAPLTDLKAEDFTVKVDGQTRPVVALHRFGATASSTGTDAPAVGRFARASDAPPGRIVVIVVDRPSIKPGSERAAVDSAAAVLKSLSPSDAVAAIGLPGGGVDLTRDHAAVAAAIKTMSGTQPTADWQHFMSWDEALGFERESRPTIDQVLNRECAKVKAQFAGDPGPQECPQAIATQWREMLLQGRGQAQTTLTGLTDLLKKLSPLHAPKQVVVFSGGLVFDLDLLARYKRLAEQAAETHVALSIVHLDQDLDASDRGHFSNVFGGREYATGLGTIASMTGGSFYMGAGKATGAFDRIATSITDFYELAVESRPEDADGRAHKIEVAVARPRATVRAPAATAVAKPATGVDPIDAALAEPTDVAELPLEVATYTTHSVDPEKVSVIVAAQLAPSIDVAPSQWGYAMVADGKVVGGSKVKVNGGTAPWAASARIDVPPGRYRLRAAAVTADGRVAMLDLPIRAGLRQADSIYASDLVVGSSDSGRLQPRARVRQDEAAIGMIELSSSEPLGDTGGEVQLIRGGTTVPALTRPLKLRTRDDDHSIVVAEASFDLSAQPPGAYTASAVIQKGGAAVARVSRVFEIVGAGAGAGAGASAGASARAGASASARAGASAGASASASAGAGAGAGARAGAGASAMLSRDPAVDELMHRVGDYVGRYGAQASVLIAVEHYKQGAVDLSDQGALSGLRAPSGRGYGGSAPSGLRADAGGPRTTDQKLVAEIALVPNASAIGGWLAYRDVIEVNGKPVPDRQNRLQALFKADVPDVEAAKRIATESARYNVGPVTRTFNVPTATLFFFDPSHIGRFTFQRAGSDTIDGVDAWKVDFQETRRPSMIMTSSGADIPTLGSLWINPADGSVLRTRLVVASYRGARSRAEIEVSYRADGTLGMLVPVRMTERYVTPTASIDGEATYSDFKRFQTSAKIK